MSFDCPVSMLDTADPTKPALLFLHGFLGCKEDWQETIEDLSDEFRCLAVDLPGHGHSAHADESCYPMPACAESLVLQLDKLHISRCALIGYSMGGRLGLYLLTHYPNRFSRAAIESASPGLRTEAEQDTRTAHDGALAAKLESIPLAQFLEEWYQQPIFAALHKYPMQFTQLCRRRMRNDPDALARSLRLMGTGVQPSLWDKLTFINAPVLYLAGAYDAKFKQLAYDMANLTPHSRAEIFSHCGHVLHFERPDMYIPRIRAFLSA